MTQSILLIWKHINNASKYFWLGFFVNDAATFRGLSKLKPILQKDSSGTILPIAVGVIRYFIQFAKVQVLKLIVWLEFLFAY